MTNSVLKTELAIIQAPMAGVQNAKLAVAVCEAGGLGSLPCAMLSAELLKSELDYLSQHTDKPYNLNFFCHQTPDYTLAQQTAWHNLLTPILMSLLSMSHNLPVMLRASQLINK